MNRVELSLSFAAVTWLWLLAFFLWLGGKPVAANPYGQNSAAEEQRRLRRVVYWQNKMKLLKLRKQENQIVEEMEAIDKETVKLHHRLLFLQKQTKDLQKEVKRAQANLQIETSASKSILMLIQPRLRLLYRMARLGNGRLLLGARSLRELAQRWKAVQVLSLRDIKLLRKYQAIRRRAERSARSWKRKQARLVQLIKKAGEQQVKFARQRSEKTALLKALYRDKEMYRRTLRVLRGQGRFIRNMVAGFQPSNLKKGLALQKGQLPWPILRFSPYCEQYQLKQNGSIQTLLCAKKRLLPRSLRCPLGRKGILLRVPEGTAALSVAKGVVAATGYKRGFGQFVIIDHKHGFYTIYAHLSRILVRKMEEVHVRYPVGLTGSTGTLGSPQLYFGMRQGIATLNPELWLKPVKR